MRCHCASKPLLDLYGHHLATGCAKMNCRFVTHDSVAHTMNDILHYTGHRTKLEERRVFQEINPDDNRRPDITVYNPSNTVAARLLLDISITSPLTGYTGGNFPVGSAAKARFNEKMNNYGAAAAQQGFSFLPIIFESTGFVHPEPSAIFVNLLCLVQIREVFLPITYMPIS